MSDGEADVRASLENIISIVDESVHDGTPGAWSRLSSIARVARAALVKLPRAAPPSGLTPPSGGATAPDPREVEIRAAADALAEVFSDRCLGCRLRQPVVELSDGWWHERVGPDRFEMQCALFDNERAALAAYRSVSAPASARSAAPDGVCDECGARPCRCGAPTTPVAGAPEGGLTPDVQRVKEACALIAESLIETADGAVDTGRIWRNGTAKTIADRIRALDLAALRVAPAASGEPIIDRGDNACPL